MAEWIIEAGNSLTVFPYRGRQVPGTQLRETAFSRPYIIRYRVDPDLVVILRVRHGARRSRSP
jgi:toxin ParE1/3/4